MKSSESSKKGGVPPVEPSAWRNQENTNGSDLAKELRRDSISTRMKLIIYAMTDEKRRFPALEGLTAIPQATWRSWWRNGVIPSGALVAAVGKQWPQFAYWLVTGMTDNDCGHIMPPLHEAAQGYIHSWPEMIVSGAPLNELKKRTNYSAEYFNLCKELRFANDANQREKHEMLKNNFLFLRKKRHEEIKENGKLKSAMES